MSFILASASPRRRELLSLITEDFTVKVSDIEEKTDVALSPEETVKELARQKGEAVFSLYPEETVIAADTVVVLDGKILGKPEDEKDAFSMLRSLSGKSHFVVTGVFVADKNKKIIFSQKTEVTFFELTDKEILDYIATKEPFDKAGAYGIQGKGSVLVKGINGDYFNVVGLPVAKLNKVLKENSYL